MSVAVVGTVGLSVVAGVLVAALVTPAIAVAGTTVNNTVGIFDSLPQFIEIDQQPQQNRIFANSNGEAVQIATMFDQNREEVAWEQVSAFVKDAAVSGEDRRFYEHGGVDPTGIARAAVTNLAEGGIAEGASTITQQYVKNTFIQAALELPTEEEQEAAYNAAIDTTFARKLQEMKLAISLEKQYTKEEILLAYLNIANFGGTTYGIEAAAQRYYNTTSLELTAAQSASLIAIVQSPTALRLDNADNWAGNTERRNVILNAMLSDGKLTEEQHAEAVAVVEDGTTITLTEPSNGCRVANNYAQYFCDYITNLIPDIASLGDDETERAANWKRGGYDVYTTLDMALQTTAQDAVWANAPNNTTTLQLGAAAVSVEVGTGRILTMAQNKTYDNTGDADPTTTAVNFNTDRAYGGSSGFQPGSTYKVFTLLNWLENGHGLYERVNGNPRTIAQSEFTNGCDPSQVVGIPYEFGNDDGFGGQMTVATGVQRSVNGAFMSMALELDLCDIKETAESIGVHRADGGELGMTPASVLGTNEIAPLTLATAYAAIANEGVYCESIAIDRIVGPDGDEIGGQPQNCSEQLSADVANTAAFAMAAVMVGNGTATRSNPNDGVEYIGKTGTTDSSNQTWVVGASTRVATAVWVGNIEGEYAMRSYRNNLGNQGGVIRHDIFRPIAQAVDKTAEYRGVAFPDPAPDLLTGVSSNSRSTTGTNTDDD
ncbi:MAG: penicillin-binding protein [Glaciihabitans sp.]|nr:penicillin-binding protein [Glaciihabitans sp.]